MNQADVKATRTGLSASYKPELEPTWLQSVRGLTTGHRNAPSTNEFENHCFGFRPTTASQRVTVAFRPPAGGIFLSSLVHECAAINLTLPAELPTRSS